MSVFLFPIFDVTASTTANHRYHQRHPQHQPHYDKCRRLEKRKRFLKRKIITELEYLKPQDTEVFFDLLNRYIRILQKIDRRRCIALLDLPNPEQDTEIAQHDAHTLNIDSIEDIKNIEEIHILLSILETEQ